jgi:hypothetical protein
VGREFLSCSKLLSCVCDNVIAQAVANPNFGHCLGECLNASRTMHVEGGSGDLRVTPILMRVVARQCGRTSYVTVNVFESF